MDWDDLRFFLQLARSRQLSGAGKALGVNDTTVARRIARLEKMLNASLVERAGRRTVITPHGELLAATCEELESIVLRKISGLGEDQMRIAGRVRIGAPEGLGVGYLARRLAELTGRYEGLETELVALPRTYSLAAREVDIAVTLDRPNSGQITIRKLTDYDLSLYATEGYLARAGRPAAVADLPAHTFAGYIPELLFTEELNFAQLSEGTQVVPIIRSTSVVAQAEAIASGAAIGILPRFLARPRSELVSLFEDELRLRRSYWLSVHDDLKHLHRVQVVVRDISAAVKADRDLFLH